MSTHDGKPILVLGASGKTGGRTAATGVWDA